VTRPTEVIVQIAVAESNVPNQVTVPSRYVDVFGVAELGSSVGAKALFPGFARMEAASSIPASASA